MKEGDLITGRDGQLYRLVEWDLSQCGSCDRITYSGLCGCIDPQPKLIGRALIGLPEAAL